MGPAPTEEQLTLLKAVRDASGRPGNQFFNTLVAEDCENLGWITSHSGGAFSLTDAGRLALSGDV